MSSSSAPRLSDPAPAPTPPAYPGPPVHAAPTTVTLTTARLVVIVLAAVVLTAVGAVTAVAMLMGPTPSVPVETDLQSPAGDPEEILAAVPVQREVESVVEGPAVAESPAPAPTPVEAPPAEKTATPTSAWITMEDTDKMTGKVTRFASLESSNAHNFGFPYRGETRARILMRTKGSIRDVIVTIDQGQIICHSFSACRVEVRFDDAPPEKYRGGESADHDSTVVFLSPASKFMAKASKAKKIKIALTIYQEGTRIFEFDTLTDTAPVAPVSQDVDAARRIGVSECDRYIESYTKCITTKVPAAARTQMLDALDQTIQAWAEAANGPARDGLAIACAAANKAAGEATASMGCEF